jgi:glycosyltransferase involved in cell wall biosynthesis
MPSVSIIVPVYKVEKCIHRCIDSILAQTFQDFEVILVEDGSPDRCGQICDEYAAVDSRITVIHKKNAGVSAARNDGIEKALQSNSDWICFVDSDDCMHPQALQMLHSTVTAHGADMCICGFQEVSTDPNPVPISTVSVQMWDAEQFFVDKNLNAVVPWAKIFRKTTFETLRFPVGVRFEDERTIYKILLPCKQIPFIDAPLYYYYINPDGFMQTRNQAARMDALVAMEETLDYFDKNGYTKALHERIITYFLALSDLLRDTSWLQAEGIYIKIELHRKRREAFRKMNGAQRVRVCNEQHPRLMRLYWMIHNGVGLLRSGDWKSIVCKIRN